MERAKYTDFLNELVHDLKNDKACFLVVAGVSIFHPSNLPSGYGLKDLCLSAITSRDRKLDKFAALLRASPRWMSLTPEILFQSLSETLSTKLTEFFGFLSYSRPNVCHGVLAYLVSTFNQPLLTTNFDTLIEARLARGHVNHLHGSVGSPHELVFRINQVGRGLDSRLRSTVSSALRGRTVYVLGYSGADRDIIRALRDGDERRLVWIVHPDPNLRGNVESVGTALRKQCSFVPIDLQSLFRELARRLSVKAASGEDTEAARRRNHLVSWSSTLSLAEAWACMGHCCRLAEAYSHARSAYLCGTRCPDGGLTRQWFLNELATTMHIAGRFPECRDFARRALFSGEVDGDPFLRAGSLNMMGLYHLERAKPNPLGALKYLRDARAAAEPLLDGKLPSRLSPDAVERFLARLYNNIGLAYDDVGRFKLARRFYQRSLRLKKRRGDLIGFAKTASNIFCLDYTTRRYGSARYWKRKALEIIDKYDLVFERAYIYRRLGEISCEQGQVRKGLRNLRIALSLYSDNPDLAFGAALTKKTIAKYQRLPSVG